MVRSEACGRRFRRHKADKTDSYRNYHEVRRLLTPVLQNTGDEAVKHIGIRQFSRRGPSSGLKLTCKNDLHLFLEVPIPAPGFANNRIEKPGRFYKVAERLFEFPLAPIGFPEIRRIEIVQAALVGQVSGQLPVQIVTFFAQLQSCSYDGPSLLTVAPVPPNGKLLTREQLASLIAIAGNKTMDCLSKKCLFLERKRIFFAEVLNGLAKHREPKIIFDGLSLLDIQILRSVPKAQLVTKMFDERTGLICCARDTGQGFRKRLRQIEHKLTEEYEAPEFVG